MSEWMKRINPDKKIKQNDEDKNKISMQECFKDLFKEFKDVSTVINRTAGISINAYLKDKQFYFTFKDTKMKITIDKSGFLGYIADGDIKFEFGSGVSIAGGFKHDQVTLRDTGDWELTNDRNENKELTSKEIEGLFELMLTKYID
ncbi:hypothetical protein DH09_08275 [Bacillaceae bacterium JMAK1]|nr:hypothetical protein DH09_08275 [Bacillaceae bacterium JMAK1]